MKGYQDYMTLAMEYIYKATIKQSESNNLFQYIILCFSMKLKLVRQNEIKRVCFSFNLENYQRNFITFYHNFFLHSILDVWIKQNLTATTKANWVAYFTSYNQNKKGLIKEKSWAAIKYSKKKFLILNDQKKVMKKSNNWSLTSKYSAID